MWWKFIIAYSSDQMIYVVNFWSFVLHHIITFGILLRTFRSTVCCVYTLEPTYLYRRYVSDIGVTISTYLFHSIIDRAANVLLQIRFQITHIYSADTSTSNADTRVRGIVRGKIIPYISQKRSRGIEKRPNREKSCRLKENLACNRGNRKSCPKTWG